MLYDAVTKKKTKLPQSVPGLSYGFSAWKASPDGSAIGEVGLPPAGVSPDSEEAEAVGGHQLVAEGHPRAGRRAPVGPEYAVMNLQIN